MTRLEIVVSAGKAFPGGKVVLKTTEANETSTSQQSKCAASPAAETGEAPVFPNGSEVGAGPRVLAPGAGAITALVRFVPGWNLICVWLVDKSGAILASGHAYLLSATPKPPAWLLRGWNPNTAACRTLGRSEAANALSVPLRTLRASGLPGSTGLTTFEQTYSSSCDWDSSFTPGSPYYLLVDLYPEPFRPALTYALDVFYGSGANYKPAADSPCRSLGGVGQSACVFDGSQGNGELLAVSGHMIIDLSIYAPCYCNTKLTVAYVHREEAQLARTIISRLPAANR